MGWLKRRPKQAPETAEFLGFGLWRTSRGWEVVEVLHDQEPDRFYFKVTDPEYVYGARSGGYGRRELATLYMTESLSLSPDRMFLVSPSLAFQMAVIKNIHGTPIMAAEEWQDGLDPLIADPAFHTKQG